MALHVRSNVSLEIDLIIDKNCFHFKLSKSILLIGLQLKILAINYSVSMSLIYADLSALMPLSSSLTKVIKHPTCAYFIILILETLPIPNKALVHI